MSQAGATSPEAIPSRRTRGWWLAAHALTVAWFIYAIPWLFHGLVIPWDAKDYYYPVFRFLATSLALGEPAQWNPYLYGGFPAIADPQSWYFSPTFRLFAWLDPSPTMMRMDAVELFHLLAGAIGLLLLCRRLALVPAAAVIAGLVFMFGGVAASRLQHSLMIVSYAYLPWAILLLTLACDAHNRPRRLLAALAFGLVAGIMAVDRDQIAFLNCLLLLAMAGWQVAWRCYPQPKIGLRTALELTPALITGFAVLAVPMLLTLDLLAMSTRPEIDFATAAHASLQPAAFLTLLAPNLYGSLQASGYWGPGEMPWMALSATGYDWTDAPVNHLYIGLVPLALLGIAAALRQPPNPYRRFFFAAFIASTLYMLGAHTPVFRVIYDWIPGVDLFRRPNDAAFLVNFGFAMLAGFAAQGVLTSRDDKLALVKGRFVLVILCLLAAIGAALWIGQFFGHLGDVARSLMFAMPILGIVVFGIAWSGARQTPLRLALSLIALTAADLIWHHSGSPLSALPADSIRAYRPEAAALAEQIRAYLGRGTDRGRAEIFGLGGSWQNAPMAYQLEQTLGYNPVRWSDYEQATGSFQNNHLPERRLTELFTGYDSPLARSLGIRVVATGAPIETILPADATKSLTLIGRHGEAYLYRNDSVLPRVMIVPPRGSRAPADDPAQALLPDLPTPGAEPFGVAEIVSYRQSRIAIQARLDQPGLLVLNDLYHPAWRVSLDGKPATLLRANTLFRAVELTAGEHSVVFSFEPLSGQSLREAANRVMRAYVTETR